jgi:acyl-CoA reductase-like NAD-dependent aldehyde dehydrogenase
VQRSIYDSFTSRLAERVARIKVGHPLDPSTEIGPLIHPRHCEKVTSYFELARKEGAQVRVGGTRPAGLDTGNYVLPTLFTGARNVMRIAQEEIFGPVLTAIPFADEAEALTLANDVRYGLTGYLWTGDVGRAHRFAQHQQLGRVPRIRAVRHHAVEARQMRRHPFAVKPTLQRFCEAKHIVVSMTADPRGFLDDELAKHGAARHVALTVSDFGSALAAAAGTDLIVAIPRRFAAMHAARPPSLPSWGPIRRANCRETG